VPVVTLTPLTPVNGIGTVALNFTAVADRAQEPITRYTVDWGDGTTSDLASLRLQSRPSSRNPISLTHDYAYLTMRTHWERCQNGQAVCPTLTCAFPDGHCEVRPRVQIVDNWGWCNGEYNPPGQRTDPAGDPLVDQNGAFGAACSGSWRTSPDTLVVRER
jgi:hypothetical protein